MRTKLTISLILLFASLSVFACRYTVREIGFSSLSNSQYSIVFIDKEVSLNTAYYRQIQNDFKDSNISLIFLNPDKDQNHPALKQVTESGIALPATILWSPTGRILELNNSNGTSLQKQILNSPLRDLLVKGFYNHFAYTILIESSNEVLNTEVLKLLQKSCSDINNRMPNMPKQVRNGAKVHRISADQWNEERIMLWSLGIEGVPETPQVFILYGRGRIIGDVLSYEAILGQEVFKRLAMIGADCECGLDKKWMLGPQIPMNWPLDIRQNLADEIGFDVDNPMVLAEMSHILSKEQINNLDTDISFAPEELDLNELFGGDSDEKQDLENSSADGFNNPFLIIIVFSSLILLVGGFLLFRARR